MPGSPCSDSRVPLDLQLDPGALWWAAVLLPRHPRGPHSVRAAASRALCSFASHASTSATREAGIDQRICACVGVCMCVHVFRGLHFHPAISLTLLSLASILHLDMPVLHCVPLRYTVTDAYYSAPEGDPPNVRYFQKPCEQNRYCVGGVAQLCGRDLCWPKPTSAVAREGRPAELAALGFAQQAGLSQGDVIEVQFDELTNEPVVNSTAAILRLFEFNAPIGYDGLQFSGKWQDPTLLLITITGGSWTSEGATDPQLTAVNVLGFRVKTQGNVRWVLPVVVHCVHGLDKA